MDEMDRNPYSPYWSYNQPGWQPYCRRGQHRSPHCKKYNAKPGEELAGRFAGEWICAEHVTPSDVPTPYQAFVDSEYPRR